MQEHNFSMWIASIIEGDIYVSHNDLLFLKAAACLVGVYVLTNIIPYPWGFLAFLGITALSLYQLWRSLQ